MSREYNARPLARGMAMSVLGIGLMLVACQSLHVYEGGRRPAAQLAHIVGDSHLSGSLPVRLMLRRVDAVELPFGYSGVYVLPGTYDFLIDCTVTESKHVSRHHVRVEVAAGVHYRLIADTGPGNRACRHVELVARE